MRISVVSDQHQQSITWPLSCQPRYPVLELILTQRNIAFNFNCWLTYYSHLFCRISIATRLVLVLYYHLDLVPCPLGKISGEGIRMLGMSESSNEY